MSEDQRMIDQKIKEMEYIIYKYEQLKKIAEGFKTCIEAIVGGDVIFRDKEGENIYYGIGRKIEDIIDFINLEIEWYKECVSKLKVIK